MAAVRQLFSRHAAEGGVRTPAAWRAFEQDLRGFGLGSAGLSALLAAVAARNFGAGRPVAFGELLAAAAASPAGGGGGGGGAAP